MSLPEALCILTQSSLVPSSAGRFYWWPLPLGIVRRAGRVTLMAVEVLSTCSAYLREISTLAWHHCSFFIHLGSTSYSFLGINVFLDDIGSLNFPFSIFFV